MIKNQQNFGAILTAEYIVDKFVRVESEQLHDELISEIAELILEAQMQYATPIGSNDQFNKENARRIELLYKKHKSGNLLIKEEQELKFLQERVNNYLSTKYPKGILAEIEGLELMNDRMNELLNFQNES